MKAEEVINAIKSNKPTSGYTILCEALDVAVSALYKQIPKKPMCRDLFELGTGIGHSCPTCGYDFPIGNYKPYKHCPDCGQALDWSDKIEQ